MKLYYSNFFIKSLLLLILLLIINLPISNLISFCLFLFATPVIYFSSISKKNNYLYIFFLILIYFFIEIIIPSTKIHEGHNLIIINENSKDFYKNNLPKEVYIFFENQFLFYANKSKCDSEKYRCWKKFKPTENRNKSNPTNNIYSKSSDWSISKIKYSRIVNNIDFNNIKSARIGEINNLSYNFFWLEKFDVVRENIPFFVMYEIPRSLVKSSMCWKGNIFWENIYNDYDHEFNRKLGCKIISDNDIGKKIYGAGFGKGTDDEILNYLYGDSFIIKNDKFDNFLSKNELNIKLIKSNKLIFYETFKLFVKIIFIFIIFIFCLKFNIKIYLLSIIHLLSFLFLLNFVNKDLILGFDIFTGGNDGLVYSSYGNIMFTQLLNFNFYEFFRGVESVFYFPSSLRYFWTINKLFFGETFYGFIFIAYIYIIVLFFIFNYLFGNKWAIFLCLLVYFSRALEGYSLSLFNFLEHINAGDAEPLAIFFFMTALLIFINFNKNNYINKYYLNFLFGFFIFLSISLRPNYFPTGFLLLFIFLIYNYFESRNIKSLFLIFLGSSFIFLIPFHNYFYGNSYIFFSSGHHHNTHAPISMYVNILNDLINFNIYNSKNIDKIIYQIMRWIKPDQIHYIITFVIIIFSLLMKNNLLIKTICLLALSQHAVLLVFEPEGRYAYLAWILTMIVFINFIISSTKFITTYQKRLNK